MSDARQGFGWNRLAEIEIPKGTIHGDRTLQDYWRRDTKNGVLRTDAQMEKAGELVRDADGNAFHLVHAPTAEQTPKRKLLEALVIARLLEARATETDQYCNPLQPDGRAQLIGARLSLVESAFQGRTDPHNLTAKRARFSGWREHRSTFGPGATFAGACFEGDVDLSASSFAGAAWFADATFMGAAHFGSAWFGGHTRFDQARFTKGANLVGAHFTDEAWFNDANFEGEAICAAITFCAAAHFAGAKFRQKAEFNVSKFHAGADFSLAQFDGLASFDGAQFEVDDQSGRLKFRDARFSSTAKFFRARFPGRLDHFGNAFSGARFLDFVDFTGAGTHWVAALNAAVFEKAVSLPRPSGATANREFRDVVLGAVEAAVREDTQREDETPASQHREWRLEQIEGGCRNLKNLLGRDRDEVLEQRYYRFQLIARRKQAATPWSEKVFSVLYGVTANYGASIGRPFASIILVVLGFAAAFWLAKSGSVHVLAAIKLMPNGRLDETLRDALSFSMSRVFPFGAFEDVSKHWISEFEAKESFTTLMVRVLASIESVFALVLIFVFGLAIRRRFQMN